MTTYEVGTTATPIIRYASYSHWLETYLPTVGLRLAESRHYYIPFPVKNRGYHTLPMQIRVYVCVVKRPNLRYHVHTVNRGFSVSGETLWVRQFTDPESWTDRNEALTAARVEANLICAHQKEFHNDDL